MYIKNKLKTQHQYCPFCGTELILDENEKLQCPRCLGIYNYNTKLETGITGENLTTNCKKLKHIKEFNAT